MTCLLAGATGLVGRAVVAQWQGPGVLHLLVRRPLQVAGPHRVVRVVDFAHLPVLPPARQAICCLGTTIAAAGSQAAFRAVDLDAVVAFARAARAAGVQRFAVVSSLGADPAARAFYSRVKGEMEAAVAALGFDCLVIARPSLLLGSREALDQPARPAERLVQIATAPLRWLIPARWRPVEAAAVAHAVLQTLASAPAGVHRLESAALQRFS